MNLKSILFSALAIMAIVTGTAEAQFTSVTATVTDTSGRAWANGTYSVSFIYTPGKPGPYIWQGATFQPQTYSGNLDGTGTFIVNIPDNSKITPAGTQWNFTICPQASFNCRVTVLSVSGSSMNISTQISSSNPAIAFNPLPVPYGYGDTEANAIPGVGQIYYDTTLQQEKFWNGSIWQTIGGVAGGGLTGQTPGYLPLATSTTSSSISSGLQDTSVNLLAHEPIGLINITPPAGVPGYAQLFSDNTKNHIAVNNNNTGELLIPGIASGATSGNVPVLASNGIDLIDSGSKPVLQSPTATQTIIQSASTSLNVTTSSGGLFNYNGSPVLTNSTGVQINPTSNQTVTQPLGTSLTINTGCLNNAAVNVQCYTGGYPRFVFPNNCSMGSASNLLTCTGVVFSASDVGNEAYVVGAGASGAVLQTTVSGFINTTTLSLAVTASTAVSGARALIAKDQTSGIQAAYNFANSNGYSLYFPPGYYLHHGLNFTGNTIKIYGDGYSVSNLVALNVTNPGKINMSAPSVGIDLSSSSRNQFSGLTVWGGFQLGLQGLGPTINLLAARAASGPNFFSVEHVFDQDFFEQYGNSVNVFLYGYEQTSFINCYFDMQGSAPIANVVLSAVNTAAFSSPYITFGGSPSSMTKVSFTGARTVFSGTGSQLALDNGTTEDVYAISLRDVYSNMASSGAGLVYQSGSGRSKEITMDNVYLESAVSDARYVIANGTAYNWDIRTGAEYFGSALTTTPLIFNQSLISSYVQMDTTGSTTAQNVSVSGSCSGTILSLGLSNPFTNCTDSGAQLQNGFSMWRPSHYTVGALPSASTLGSGAMLVVTDATSFTPGTCVGGGSSVVLAISNGSSWICQ